MKSSKIFILASVFLLVILTGAYFLISNEGFSSESGEEVDLPDNYVTRVIDGDTFVLANEEVVRLLCVDTPEVGEEGFDDAKLFLEDLIVDKEVRMESGGKDKDVYGRLLRYVYVGDVLVNREIVEQGLGVVYDFGVGGCD